MGEVVKFRKQKLKDKHKGRTLCQSGFHKWVIDNQTPFDSKQGKMLTRYRCQRCGASKTEAR